MHFSRATVLLFVSSVAATGSLSNAEAAFATLMDWYNETSGLWNTCGWWNGANCMTVIGDLAAVDDSIIATATSVFATTYTNAPASNPALQVNQITNDGQRVSRYGSHPPVDNMKVLSTTDGGNAPAFYDGYYDDAGWWALAWIQAYDLTNNAPYLETAMGIFDNMTAAGPTNCSNGGIVWSAKVYYVNAIVNELYLSVAAHLASRVPSNATYYTDIANDQWSWFQASGLINSNNTINDGLTLSCENNNETVWSYNQGVILGALVELNNVTGNASLLTAAGNIAKAAIANLTDSDSVLHDPCEPNCGVDATQFKGVFMRNLMVLQQAAPDDSYVQVINASANSIWANDRVSNNSLSVDWAGPFVAPVNASTHSSAMDALVAQVVVT